MNAPLILLFLRNKTKLTSYMPITGWHGALLFVITQGLGGIKKKENWQPSFLYPEKIPLNNFCNHQRRAKGVGSFFWIILWLPCWESRGVTGKKKTWKYVSPLSPLWLQPQRAAFTYANHAMSLWQFVRISNVPYSIYDLWRPLFQVSKCLSLCLPEGTCLTRFSDRFFTCPSWNSESCWDS